MEIKQLKYFIATVEEGNICAAANRLHISQPALSISIKKLEEEVGAQLFFTIGRHRYLTDAGNVLLARAYKLIDVYQQTIDDVQSINQRVQGQIRFGLPPLMGACFFGQIIPTFTKKYPDVEISIIEEGAVKLDTMIADGTLDIALSLPTKRNIGFERRYFSRQQNMVLLHRDHPLAARNRLTVADLRDERFAFFTKDFILHEQLVEACYKEGFSPKFSIMTTQWDFMAEVVSKNHGITILPRPVCESCTKKDIVTIPLEDSIMQYWDVIVIWNKARHFSHVCNLFYEHIIKNATPSDGGLQE